MVTRNRDTADRREQSARTGVNERQAFLIFPDPPVPDVYWASLRRSPFSLAGEQKGQISSFSATIPDKCFATYPKKPLQVSDQSGLRGAG
jgi:hypothetical protein